MANRVVAGLVVAGLVATSLVATSLGVASLGTGAAHAAPIDRRADSGRDAVAGAKDGAARSVTRSGATPQAVMRAQNAWRQSMLQHPHPQTGCYTAAYPNRIWQAVACGQAPTAPQMPRTDILQPRIVGGGAGDYAAGVAATVSAMTGSFDSVQGVRQITGGPNSASSFALQLNTNTFNTSACQGAGCLGWEQFIYSNTGAVYIEYTFLQYGPNCPNNWGSYSLPPGKACFFNTPMTPTPVQGPATLGALRLTASATSGGNDTVTLATSPTQVYSLSYADNVLNLSQGWTGAQFNIVGDTSGSQTNFNPGSFLGVRVNVDQAAPQIAPKCVPGGGTTAETNNLNSAQDCSVSGQSILYSEANTPLITGISPTSGPANGGATVTLTGSGFTGATNVTFTNGSPTPVQAPFTFVSDATITAVSPACSPLGCDQGTFGQLITVAGPTGSGSSRQGFGVYPVVTGVQPRSGPPGTTVTVTGNGFATSTPSFLFGGQPATDVYCAPSANVSCTMTAPGPAPGAAPVDVRYGGTSPTSPADQFTYSGGAVQTCQFAQGGCPAQGGNQLFSVTCGAAHDFSVNGVKSTGLSVGSQELGAYQYTYIQACFQGTSNCQEFDTSATEVCPIHPILPPDPIKNCRVCTETGRKCVPMAGGFRCVGNLQ